MKNTIIILLLLVPVIALAQKRKKIKKEPITVINTTYSYVHNAYKTTGDIYEIEIQTKYNNIVIDSIWFGATPVPCDIYDKKNGQRIFDPLAPGLYMIKANKDLYKYFYRNIDSTTAYQRFVPPFTFNAVCVIFYKYNNKRMYYTILNATEKPQKQLRERE